MFTQDPESSKNAAGPPIVYLVQQPSLRNGRGPDISRAWEHGEVRLLLSVNDIASYRPNECLALLRERLAGFRPEVDRLLFAGGDPWAPALALLALAQLGHRRVTFLRYQRSALRDGSYVYVPTEVVVAL